MLSTYSFVICVFSLISIVKCNGDATDDIFNQIDKRFSKIDDEILKLKKEIIWKDEYLVKLEDKIMKLEEEIARKDDRTENMDQVEDVIEERVSKLEQLAKTGTLRTCSEYAKYGLALDDVYTIDPDGPLMGHEPFKVFCNFTEGSTSVYHNTEEKTEVEHCHDPGCYNKSITYIDGEMTNERKEIAMEQIVSLIQLSDRCEQSFQYDCLLAPLRGLHDVDLAYWEDRNNEINNYFTGSNYGNHMCDCHNHPDGCAEEAVYNNTCNCDANLPAPLKDTGIITNSSALPITKMYFGGLNYETQSGAFVLGRLKCFGEKSVSTATSCSALKKSGIFKSGYYSIKPEGATQQMSVFCNMSKSYNDVTETDELIFGAPIGTILSWVPKVDQAGSLLPIPDGWVPCNGSSITKGPFAGGTTPDLNGPGLFLRGGDENRVLEVEESKLMEHGHVDPGHSHSCSLTSKAAAHQHKEYFGREYNEDGHFTSWETVDITTSCDVASQSSNLGGVDTNNVNAGDENRPANMKVVYIIRIY